MSQYNVDRITLSNNHNQGLYDYLVGLADYFQEFDLSGKKNASIPTAFTIISLSRGANCIHFNIQETKTKDSIAGLAIRKKK